MDGSDDLRLIDHPDSTEEIPILDISSFFDKEPGAKKRAAEQLREISEKVGFFYLAGHGVPQELIDRVFAQSRRLHELPRDVKEAIPKSSRVGYHGILETAAINPAAGTPSSSLTSTFVIHPDRSADDPRVIPDHPFWGLNVWPQDLPGFRETVVEYHKTMSELGRRMMPLWAATLDLPDDYFDDDFREPYVSLRLAHYPPQKEIGNRKYGISPHTDNSTMTILAQANVPGLAVEMPSGHWRIADIIPGTFMVNTGNTMVRYSNGRYLSTKHRVINTANVDRYSIPVFFGPNQNAIIDCVPTCRSEDHPPEYPPIKYEDLMHWYFINRGYDEKSVGPDAGSKGRWVK